MKLKTIRMENITKEIKGGVILNEVSFEIKAGEICAIIGKNGAGKSTLFKIMTGQITPTKGEFSFIYTGKNESSNIGTLIERPIFFNNFSAFDNLKYFSYQKGKDSTKEIEEILEIVGLPQNKKPFSSFSLGMKQRLGIALALIFKPDILILDEPVNGLDPEGIRDIRKILLKVNKEYRTTILISSHVLTELEEISDSYIFIDKGRVIEKTQKIDLEEKLIGYSTIVVDDLHKAVRVMNDYFPKINYTVENNKHIKIIDSNEFLGAINQKMVINNVLVLGIETKKSTLEDYFFEVLSRSEQI